MRNPVIQSLIKFIQKVLNFNDIGLADRTRMS